jgi:hypothetical protein
MMAAKERDAALIGITYDGSLISSRNDASVLITSGSTRCLVHDCDFLSVSGPKAIV